MGRLITQQVRLAQNFSVSHKLSNIKTQVKMTFAPLFHFSTSHSSSPITTDRPVPQVFVLVAVIKLIFHSLQLHPSQHQAIRIDGLLTKALLIKEKSKTNRSIERKKASFSIFTIKDATNDNYHDCTLVDGQF